MYTHILAIGSFQHSIGIIDPCTIILIIYITSLSTLLASFMSWEQGCTFVHTYTIMLYTYVLCAKITMLV